MQKKLADIVNEQELDRQIAEVEEELKNLQFLQQRRAELLNFKMIATRLWGSPAKTSPSNGHKASSNGRVTTAGLLYGLLAEQGALTTADLLASARQAGYTGSGDDAKDKKRLLAAMYGATGKFERVGDKWNVAD